MSLVQGLPNMGKQTIQIPIAIAAYLGLCGALRYQRIKRMHAKYKYGTPAKPSYQDMTDQEAYEIMFSMAQLEFPAMYGKGLQFALFRTYAIPTISSLLIKTAQLSEAKTVSKRYADTGALMVEIYGNAPDSERARDAFARLNYLHSFYIRQGKISNDDMLFTLAMFMNQPVAWINRYEWRQLSDLEVCALGVFHKSMGDAMEISFDVLPGSKTGWKDGLQFYRELDEWSRNYEGRYMIPHERNHQLAVRTKEVMVDTAPRFIHNFLSQLVDTVLDDRLRVAMMFDKPPAIFPKMLNWFMNIRKIFLGYLALPRPYMLRHKMVDDKADAEGRRHMTEYSMDPYYVKPTLWNRYGPGALVARLNGQSLPGDPGMYPEGFLTKDLGPKTFLGKGYAEIEKTKKKLAVERTGVCPVFTRI